jgi:hypothetical protein
MTSTADTQKALNAPMLKIEADASLAVQALDSPLRDVTRKALKAMIAKECRRCSGNGTGYFLGGDRPPATCFDCGGSGKVAANRTEAAKVAVTIGEAEVSRYRTMWKIYNQALAAAKLTPDTFWKQSVIQQFETTLKNVEAAGKDAAAKLAQARAKLK